MHGLGNLTGVLAEQSRIDRQAIDLLGDAVGFGVNAMASKGQGNVGDWTFGGHGARLGKGCVRTKMTKEDEKNVRFVTECFVLRGIH